MLISAYHCFRIVIFIVFSYLAVIIKWTDQIKELLKDQERMTMMYKGSPLEEIAFWKSHSTKLLNVIDKLQKSETRHIQHILQLSNSRYLQRFHSAVKELEVQKFWKFPYNHLLTKL